MVLRMSTGAEIERHRAGVDGGEVEDVVDDRQQRVGRDRDVARDIRAACSVSGPVTGSPRKCAKPMMLVSGERSS